LRIESILVHSWRELKNACEVVLTSIKWVDLIPVVPSSCEQDQAMSEVTPALRKEKGEKMNALPVTATFLPP